MKIGRLFSLSLSLSLAAGPALGGKNKTVNWPSFRGAAARGVGAGAETATRWNVEEGHNVAWRAPIPGLGHSSPVIWGDRVFVTTAVSGMKDPELRVGLYGDVAPVVDDTVHSFRVLSLDKATGEVLWQKTAYEGVPKIRRHTKATHANSTPAVSADAVVAFFGSEGLYCFSHDGELRWKKDFGVLDSGFFRLPEAQWGFASSPVIDGDRVIVQVDVQKGSFIAAFYLADGKEVWRTERDEIPTWSTPTVHRSGDRAQVITNGFRHIGGYDLATGKELWRLRGGGDIPVPTPIVDDGLIFITNAHGGVAPIYAISVWARGDITPEGDARSGTHLAWSTTSSGAYMQTPLVLDGRLYLCRDNGTFHVYAAPSGKLHYKQRLAKQTGFTASTVAADGRIYQTSEMGDVYVIAAGSEFELLATNQLDAVTLATPAISDGSLFFRTKRDLIAIREGAGKEPAADEPATRPAKK